MMKMTVKELINALSKLDPDTIAIIGDGDGDGWANIERIEIDKFQTALIPEKFPIFSEN